MSDKPEILEQKSDPVTEPTQKEAEKLFTQEQLDKIISSRLERERLSKSQDLDEVKANQDALAKNLEAAESTVSKYQKILSGMVEKQLKSLAPAVKELVMKLDPADQLTWLESNADNLSKFTKKSVDPIPASEPLGDVDMEKLKEQKQAQYGQSL